MRKLSPGSALCAQSQRHSLFPPSSQRKIVQNSHCGMRFVQRVEMNSWRSLFEQIFTLSCCVFDPEFSDRNIVLTEFVQLRGQCCGDPRAAHFCETLNLRAAQYRHDTWHERSTHSMLFLHVLAELVVIGIIKEQLCHHEIRPGVDFFL